MAAKRTTPPRQWCRSGRADHVGCLPAAGARNGRQAACPARRPEGTARVARRLILNSSVRQCTARTSWQGMAMASVTLVSGDECDATDRGPMLAAERWWVTPAAPQQGWTIPDGRAHQRGPEASVGPFIPR